MRERASGRGRVRDCVCVRVGARLSAAWKVMDNGGGGGEGRGLRGGGTGASSESLTVV